MLWLLMLLVSTGDSIGNPSIVRVDHELVEVELVVVEVVGGGELVTRPIAIAVVLEVILHTGQLGVQGRDSACSSLEWRQVLNQFVFDGLLLRMHCCLFNSR